MVILAIITIIRFSLPGLCFLPFRTYPLCKAFLGHFLCNTFHSPSSLLFHFQATATQPVLLRCYERIALSPIVKNCTLVKKSSITFELFYMINHLTITVLRGNNK